MHYSNFPIVTKAQMLAASLSFFLTLALITCVTPGDARAQTIKHSPELTKS